MNHAPIEKATRFNSFGGRTLRTTGYALLLMLSVLLMAGGCGKKQQNEPEAEKPIPVTVITPIAQPHASIHRVSGLVSADEEAMLSFKTGGVIKDILVDVGDTFRKGQILAALDTTEVAAMVVDAEQTAQLAANDYRRVKRLYADSVATKQQYEAAKAGKERAEAGLRRARFNLEHSLIRAPFAGTVNMKLNNRGEIVGARQSILRVLKNGSGASLSVRVTVPAILLSNLKRGQKLDVTIEGLSNPVTGTVAEISSSVETGGGGFPVKINLPAEGSIHPGLVATVHFHGQDRMMVSLPSICLSSVDQDRGFVFLVDDNKASRWPVTVLALDGANILIEPTLPEGSRVIVQGTGYVLAK